MTYCFATGLEEEYEVAGTRYAFDNFLWQMRLRNVKGALENDVVKWVRENAPETIMVVREAITKHRATILDGKKVFQNIHPTLDGLTRDALLGKIKDKTISEVAVAPFIPLIMAQVSSEAVHSSKTTQWVAQMSDRAAVEYKLRFPKAVAV